MTLAWHFCSPFLGPFFGHFKGILGAIWLPILGPFWYHFLGPFFGHFGGNLAPHFGTFLGRAVLSFQFGSTKMSQNCHKNVTKLSQKCHKNVTKMSQKCHKNDICVPHFGTFFWAFSRQFWTNLAPHFGTHFFVTFGVTLAWHFCDISVTFLWH